jgi:hypothetical protein
MPADSVGGGALISIIGNISVLFGDPASNSGKPSKIVELATRPGHAVVLVADSVSTLAPNEVGRFNGRRVRAYGWFACGDERTFHVTSLEVIPMESE